MANSVRVFAPAKINLFLHVGDRRGDGFHPLESLAVFVNLGDDLVVERSDTLSLAIDGPFAGGLEGDSDNLVLKAARALNVTGRIVLTKNLPVASGIGGGSADAAAALRGLDALWNLDRSDLLELAAALGSDVPVCISSKAAWMQGRGEILKAAAVPPLPMVLVNPKVGVSTADVFRALKNRSGLGMRLDWTGDPIAFLHRTANDLEAPAKMLQPVIGDVLAALRSLPGVLLGRMSGSGATCFGIFESELGASRAAEAVAADHPDWWVRATRIAQ